MTANKMHTPEGKLYLVTEANCDVCGYDGIEYKDPDARRTFSFALCYKCSRHRPNFRELIGIETRQEMIEAIRIVIAAEALEKRK